MRCIPPPLLSLKLYHLLRREGGKTKKKASEVKAQNYKECTAKCLCPDHYCLSRVSLFHCFSFSFFFLFHVKKM